MRVGGEVSCQRGRWGTVEGVDVVSQEGEEQLDGAGCYGEDGAQKTQ